MSDTPTAADLADDILEDFSQATDQPAAALASRAYDEAVSVCAEYHGNHINEYVVSGDDRDLSYDNHLADIDTFQDIAAAFLSCRARLITYLQTLIDDAYQQAADDVGPFPPDDDEEPEDDEAEEAAS